MRRLIDLAKGKPRVYINLRSEQAKTDFLKQAEMEGFRIYGKLPTECECDNVMIIQDNFTITRLDTWGAVAPYPCSERVDFEKYIIGKLKYHDVPIHL